MTARPFGITNTRRPKGTRWFATTAARDAAWGHLHLADGQTQFAKVSRSLVACASCGGETVPPDPSRSEEEHHYCEACGRTTAAS